MYLLKLQVSENTVIPDDPVKDQSFKEPLIDSLRAQMDDVSFLKSKSLVENEQQFLTSLQNWCRILLIILSYFIEQELDRFLTEKGQRRNLTSLLL